MKIAASRLLSNVLPPPDLNFLPYILEQLAYFPKLSLPITIRPVSPSFKMLTLHPQVGAFLTTSECVILGLAPDAANPKFKGLQKLVMEPALDTGL